MSRRLTPIFADKKQNKTLGQIGKSAESRGPGVSLKPGVKRSGTPGTRQLKIIKARGAADSGINAFL